MNHAAPSEVSVQSVVSRFHRELEAAVMSRVPLRLGPSVGSSSSQASVDTLMRLEEQVNDRLAEGQTLAQVLSSEDLPVHYCAAFRLFTQTNDTGLVLDGLSIDIRTQRQFTSMLRPALAYLAAIMLLAAVLLFLFANYIVPRIDSMREGTLVRSSEVLPERFDMTRLLPYAVPALSCAAFTSVLMMFVVSSGMVTWLDGRRHQTQLATATALRAIRSLVSRGMPLREATGIACNLVCHAGTVRAQVDTIIKKRPMSINAASQLDSAADHCYASALNRLARIRAILPITMVAVFGGVTALGYGLLVFWPICSLLHDLAIPGG